MAMLMMAMRRRVNCLRWLSREFAANWCVDDCGFDDGCRSRAYDYLLYDCGALSPLGQLEDPRSCSSD